MRSRRHPPTASEKRHLDRVAALGCIVCRLLFRTFSPALIHHIRSLDGKRITRNHMLVLPLCWDHHSADSPYGFHHGTRTWQAMNGTEADLLAQVMAQLQKEVA